MLIQVEHEKCFITSGPGLNWRLKEYSKCSKNLNRNYAFMYELCLEKTCLWDFGPGAAQTGLYNHIR